MSTMQQIVSLEPAGDASLRIAESLQRGIADPRLYYAEGRSRYYDMEYEARTDRGVLKNPAAYATMLRNNVLTGSDPVTLAGIGCGDARNGEVLLRRLAPGSPGLRFAGVDLSKALLTKAAQGLEPLQIPTLLIQSDFATETCRQMLLNFSKGSRRVFLFVGNTFSNFEPADMVGLLKEYLEGGDLLLFDIFVRTGYTPADDAALKEKYLRDFSAPKEREFLLSALPKLGIGETDGRLEMDMETDPDTQALQFTFRFRFISTVSAEYGGTVRIFLEGESLRLFRFYVHHPEALADYMKAHGLPPLRIQREGREALVLARRAPVTAMHKTTKDSILSAAPVQP